MLLDFNVLHPVIFTGEERSLTMVFMGGQASRFVASKSEHDGSQKLTLGRLT